TRKNDMNAMAKSPSTAAMPRVRPRPPSYAESVDDERCGPIATPCDFPDDPATDGRELFVRLALQEPEHILRGRFASLAAETPCEVLEILESWKRRDVTRDVSEQLAGVEIPAQSRSQETSEARRAEATKTVRPLQAVEGIVVDLFAWAVAHGGVP